MQLNSIFPSFGAAALIAGLSLLTQSTSAVPAAAAEPALVDMVRDGELSFVVSDIGWALGPDAEESGGCPNGLALNAGDALRATPEGRQREGESDDDYTSRLREVSTARRNQDLPNACMFPEAHGPDPNYHTVIGSDIPVWGIDLDSQPTQAGTCSHGEFRGVNGERGIDNQFYRVVGCTEGWQSTGTKIPFATEMLTGAWGILITVKGIDDLANDDDVEVGIHANGDPITLSGDRTALHHATYVIHQAPRFQARTRGRIVDGVLITDPVDVRFPSTTNAMYLERPLDDARLRLTFTEDGELEGIMAGYTNVDELYDFLMGFRNGKTADGELARQRAGSAGGSSSSAGLTCNGIYHAMKELADGHRDPETGQCSALSTQYRIKAVPAFVSETPAQNVVARRSE